MRAFDDIATVVQVFEVDVLRTAAVQDEFLLIGRQFVERNFQAELVVRGQRAEHLEVIDVAPVPATNRPFGQGQFAIDQALDVEELLHPQTIAGRASAGRVVEGEQLGFQFADRVAADRAGEACGEDHLFTRLVVHRRHQGDAVRQFQRGLEGFGQALLQVGANLEAVDHDIDGMFFLLVELGSFVQLIELSIDSGADKTLRAQLFENRQVLAFALADDRRQQHQLAALRFGEDQVDHLADGLRFKRDVVIRATGNTHTCIKQAQVVVDFGDSADRRARVVRGRLLFDGDRRRQAFDGVDVGLFHHRQELPGVGRQRFDVAALTFGVQGVESQG
ncbi:hypothetical protein D3C72_1420540 [compost metagenome]